jgi:hypothetical protein
VGQSPRLRTASIRSRADRLHPGTPRRTPPGFSNRSSSQRLRTERRETGRDAIVGDEPPPPHPRAPAPTQDRTQPHDPD